MRISDWSSDVCSSDLGRPGEFEQLLKFAGAPFDGFVNLNYNWRGRIQWDIFQDPQAIEDSVGLLSGAVGIRAKDRRYSLSLFAKNLTTKFYTHGLRPGTAIVGFIPLDYRLQVGVQLSLEERTSEPQSPIRTDYTV